MDQPLRLLSSEEIEAYDRDGVTHARGLFPDVWIERMTAAVDRVVESPSLFGSIVSAARQNLWAESTGSSSLLGRQVTDDRGGGCRGRAWRIDRWLRRTGVGLWRQPTSPVDCLAIGI